MRRFAELMAAALSQHLATRRRVRLPDGGGLFWSAFADLSAGRGYSERGPMPIGLEAIEAWARLSRVPLEARHVAVIRAMDRAWLEDARKPPPLTGAALDRALGL